MLHVVHIYQGLLYLTINICLFFFYTVFVYFRSPMLPGSVEQKEIISDADEPLATSPPLELRRPASGTLRSTIAVPHSLQSPQDRATGKYFFTFRNFSIHNTLNK